MKRHRKLIRLILQYAESNASGSPLDPPNLEGFTLGEVNYHIGLCDEAKFLHVASTKSADDPRQYRILNLTWKGHEILDPNGVSP